MPTVHVGLDGTATHIADGATAFDAVGDKARQVVAARVNDVLVDLSHLLQDGDRVEAVLVGEPDGLSILRHSVAHIVAQATQSLFDDVHLGVGPPIKDGFFYDFGTRRTFTPEDLTAIEQRTVELIKSGQSFTRRVVDREQARNELAHEPFKIRLLGSDADATVLDADVMEVGGAELTVYDNCDLRSGDRTWFDLCRGPHVPDTRYMDARAVRIMRSSAAYWLGDQKKDRKSTRLNSSHVKRSRMPSSA